MDLIACVCFLRQYQKADLSTPDGLSYIACDKEDYRIASRIMKAILPLTLTSFPKSALTLFDTFRRLISEKAKAEGLEPLEVSLTQRELRELGSLSQMIVKRGLKLLCEYEYLREVGSSRNGFKRSYKLAKDLPIELVDLSAKSSTRMYSMRQRNWNFINNRGSGADRGIGVLPRFSKMIVLCGKELRLTGAAGHGFRGRKRRNVSRPRGCRGSGADRGIGVLPRFLKKSVLCGKELR